MNLIGLKPERQYKLLTLAATVGAAMGTHKILTESWKAVTKKDPPKNPSSPSVLWQDALLWGATAGLTVGIVKTITRRIVAGYWRTYMGAKPEEPFN